jgi:hypothetical protein
LAQVTRTHLLTFNDIPWPVFDPQPKQPSDITPERIQRFISHYQSEIVRIDRALRDELLRWHPDKFDVKILAQVDAQYYANVQDARQIVSAALTEMNSQVRSS